MQTFKLAAYSHFYHLISLLFPFGHYITIVFFHYSFHFQMCMCSIQHLLSLYIVVQSNHKMLKTPRVGEQITIVTTCVLNARKFYGQLGVHYNALQLSQQRLNSCQVLFCLVSHFAISFFFNLLWLLLLFRSKLKLLKSSTKQKRCKQKMSYNLLDICE